ncbi:MAG: hypothetical protein ABJG78_13105 [Cyclobacteriaceae bacterium]
MTPEVFAPGVISTQDKYEMNSIFSLAGDEFYYVISSSTPEEKEKGEYFYYLMFTRIENGVWTKPERAPFSGINRIADISLSPDGNRLYFCSEQTDPPDYAGPMDLWYVERVGSEWSDPVRLDPPINSPAGETQPTFTRDGTMYFSSGRGGKGNGGIFYSKYMEGKYSEPVRMGKSINPGYCFTGNSFISPDESYLLFARWGIPDSIPEERGMYVSFKKQDGSWTEAKNTKPETGLYGGLAALSHDEKYLFYSSGGDIYWVDSRITEKLKPDYKE